MTLQITSGGGAGWAGIPGLDPEANDVRFALMALGDLMGTSEDLVRACAQLVAEEGVAALSLRKVAQRVGIKAPSVYAHFEGKEALLLAAQGEACAGLREALLSHAKGPTPRKRLVAMGLGYLAFAEAHPDLFDLMFFATRSASVDPAGETPESSPYGVLRAEVARFLGDEGPKADELSFGIWSLVHGAAVLRRTHLKGLPLPLKAWAQSNLSALLDQWEAR